MLTCFWECTNPFLGRFHPGLIKWAISIKKRNHLIIYPKTHGEWKCKQQFCLYLKNFGESVPFIENVRINMFKTNLVQTSGISKND